MIERFIIGRPEQVEAMSGPLQHQIVSSLERLGAVSVRELANHLGVAADSLYYHVRKLEAAGVLVVASQRSTGRRPETVYKLPGRELVLDPTSQAPRFLAALARLHKSLMAMATRLYERALSSSHARRHGPSRNLCILQQNTRLKAADLKELNRRLEEIAEFVAERDDPKIDQFVSLTISMSPVVRE